MMNPFTSQNLAILIAGLVMLFVYWGHALGEEVDAATMDRMIQLEPAPLQPLHRGRLFGPVKSFHDMRSDVYAGRRMSIRIRTDATGKATVTAIEHGKPVLIPDTVDTMTEQDWEGGR